MAVTTPDYTSSARPLAQAQPTSSPVKVLAVLGGLLVLFEAWVIVRWVSGPLFERVPVGPSDPPTAMKVNLIFWQAVSIPIAVGIVYWFVVRAWRRLGRLTVDGLLVIAFMTLWFQDPLANALGPWITYNSYLVNFGSWANSTPGFQSFGAPGQMLVEPVLIIPALYIYFFLLAAALGCWVMRRTRARWPRATPLQLAGACFATMLVVDLVLEGMVWMPGGIWTYAGGHVGLLFPSSYHKFPLQELVTASATLTSVACLRFFRDDRGRTAAERGSESLAGSSARTTTIRALATIAAVQILFAICYTVPNTFLGAHTTAWPRDVQKRSYFTDGICGAGTSRACPGPGVPLTRNDNSNPDKTSFWVSPRGTLVKPSATRLPAPVPFTTK